MVQDSKKIKLPPPVKLHQEEIDGIKKKFEVSKALKKRKNSK